ncbi:MAG: benzoate/H(+) symporter BenE family transporter [Gammaproteobacteria bacterium]|nr:benzoate/H(+) symporter BenE family transporter [Gammaproteobacteria bacterium]
MPQTLSAPDTPPAPGRPWQPVLAGTLAACVGFAGSFAVVLQGLSGAGANAEQAASGLLAAAVACGLCGIVISLYTRLPVAIAWSTPGAALLATSGPADGGFAGGVGAFIMCAAGFIIAGLWRPFGAAVAAIPKHLASAMLAGVLLGLCLAPVKAIAHYPLFGLCILAAWVVGALVNRLWAVPAALAAFAGTVVLGLDLPDGTAQSLQNTLTPPLVWITPHFSIEAFLSISIPLFLVTMASQNIAGIAVLTTFGYSPRPGPWIATTGLFSALAAPFGCHAVNLAAITAAMCAGDDAHPDRDKRYWAAVWMGIGMIVLGLLSGAVIAFVVLAPPILIQAVAGLALVGAFSSAALAAFEDPKTREASVVTFLFAASGITIAGISGAFWGLLAGGAMSWAQARRRQEI